MMDMDELLAAADLGLSETIAMEMAKSFDNQLPPDVLVAIAGVLRSVTKLSGHPNPISLIDAVCDLAKKRFAS